ncbi:MAG TPA: GNAT family N-acetyltransferase [Blastocatellia bacterium]|nr:GNAT family N-acetyltransferase [Blastocatellia bacterium]
MPEIETSRLLLRMFKPDDLDDISRIYADADVMRYLSGHPLTREETAGWLNYFLAGWENYGFGWWALVLKKSGELIGHCGLQFIHVTPEVEVTYALAKAYWRMGLASEAARACLRYGFAELKLDRIYALADPGNIGSHRVMERIGMRYDKTEYYKDDLYEGDLIYYAIARNAYQHDGSPYSFRPVAGDDTRTRFSRAFDERKREWKNARAAVE